MARLHQPQGPHGHRAGKVTKRNNFLVEELETWKQQFLKFQAFAEQLTKELTELGQDRNHKTREPSSHRSHRPAEG